MGKDIWDSGNNAKKDDFFNNGFLLTLIWQKPKDEKNNNTRNQPNIVRILKHGQTAPIHHNTPKNLHKETCSTLQTTKAKKKAKQAWFCRFALSGCLMYYGSLKTRKTVRRRHAGCVVPKTQQGNCAGGLSADYRPRIGDTPRLKRYVRLPPVNGRKRATRMHGIMFRQTGCCLQPLIRLHRSGFASDGCCVRQVVKERVLLNLVWF